MITMTNVTLTFPDGAARVRALDAVSLVVRPGTITGITGPSGSGKSSLLAVASTLIRPDSGRVVIDDVEASALSPRRHRSCAARASGSSSSSPICSRR